MDTLGGMVAGEGDDKSSAVTKQQRWLLFLRHCAKCRQSEQECSLKAQCKFGKQLWHHILHCANVACDFPRCTNSKDLLKHHQKCQVGAAGMHPRHVRLSMRPSCMISPLHAPPLIRAVLHHSSALMPFP